MCIKFNVVEFAIAVVKIHNHFVVENSVLISFILWIYEQFLVAIQPDHFTRNTRWTRLRILISVRKIVFKGWKYYIPKFHVQIISKEMIRITKVTNANTSSNWSFHTNKVVTDIFLNNNIMTNNVLLIHRHNTLMVLVLGFLKETTLFQYCEMWNRRRTTVAENNIFNCYLSPVKFNCS